MQDKGFQAALVTARFARAVRHLREPFYLLCGLGETGLTGRPRARPHGPPLRGARRRRGAGRSSSTSATSPPTRRRWPATSPRPRRWRSPASPSASASACWRSPRTTGRTSRSPWRRGCCIPALRTIARAHDAEAMAAMETCGVDRDHQPLPRVRRAARHRDARARHPPAAHLADRPARRPPAGAGPGAARALDRLRLRPLRHRGGAGAARQPASTSRSSTPTSRRRPASTLVQRPRLRPGQPASRPGSTRPRASSPAATTTSPTWRWRWRRASSSPASS